MGNALFPQLPDGAGTHVHQCGGGLHGALKIPVQAGNNFADLLLAVAFHTGNAEDFAPADAEAHVVEDFLGAEDILGHMLHGQHRLAQSILFLVDLHDNIPAHHHAGNVRLGDVRHIAVIDGLTGPHDRDPVAELLDLVELVGNKDDGIALLFQALQLHEQFSGLLRGQNGGGLVENDDFGATDQDLQNFHLLLLSNGQIPDLGIRVPGRNCTWRPLPGPSWWPRQNHRKCRLSWAPCR